MPRPLLGLQGAQADQVNQANSTLNHLMPGRQKPWMTNSASVQSNAYRPRPLQNLQNLPRATPEQVRTPREPSRPETGRDEAHFELREPQQDPTYVPAFCLAITGHVLCLLYIKSLRAPSDPLSASPLL